MKITAWLLGSFCLPLALIADEEPKSPFYLRDSTHGTHLIMMIRREGDLQKLRKHPGTEILNFEPGCIVVEAFCKFIGKNRLQIHFPDKSYTSESAKNLLNITSNRFELTFKPSDNPNKSNLITSVTELKNAESPQGGADQPATAPESNPEGNQKPQSESQGRPQ